MFVQIAQLRKRAKEKGISASYLCRAVGKNVTYIADAERYRYKIADDIANKWAEILETTPEYLCGETDDPTVPKEQKEEDEMKVALFGGEKATDEEWEEVKKFVAFLKSRREKNDN